MKKIRIPFNIAYRQQIQDDVFSVETRDGLKARIVCWNRKNNIGKPIAALVEYQDKSEYCRFYNEEGVEFPQGIGCCNTYDLFIVLPTFQNDVVSETRKQSFREFIEDAKDYFDEHVCGGCNNTMVQDFLKYMENNNKE